MNLYKIIFEHYSPKDSAAGIACLAIAENDEMVYDFIDKEYTYEMWSDSEEEEEEFEIYDDDYNVIGTETFKEKIIRIKGEVNDESYNFSDLYYGLTLYGWELLKENTTSDYTEMIELGIVKVID